MNVSFESCAFSVRGLCGGPILRPEEFYRLWRVCDLRTSTVMRLRPQFGCCDTGRYLVSSFFSLVDLFPLFKNWENDSLFSLLLHTFFIPNRPIDRRQVSLFIIIIIIIIIISFMHGIYTHIPETNHVPRGYIVASILSLLFMVPLFLVPALALLFFYVSTSRSMCAVPSMAVFCSSLTSRFPGMSLTCFLNDFEMVPVAPIITDITLAFHSTYAVFLL
jgi:hypothetical protein